MVLICALQNSSSPGLVGEALGEISGYKCVLTFVAFAHNSAPGCHGLGSFPILPESPDQSESHLFEGRPEFLETPAPDESDRAFRETELSRYVCVGNGWVLEK